MEKNAEKSMAFTGYEYKTVAVRKEREGLWIDSMKNYGWELTKSRPAVVKHVWGPLRIMAAPLALIPGTPFARMVVDHDSEKKTELTFKRDREIENKAELSQLQRQFEVNALELEELEDSKKFGASVVSCCIGIWGTVFLGAATFCYLAGNIPACIVLAVPGFLGWILPAFLYKILKDRRAEKVAPVMEQRYEAINSVNEQSFALLH